MKRRILLADDSVTIQKVIELTFMDDDHYEVRPVSNGDEALALLPELSPDFVIADVHMPGASGYAVCRRAKQLRPDVPVLLLVGTFEPFDEGEARKAGADSYLKKPFDSQELLQRVEELLAAGTAAAGTATELAPEAAPPFPAEPLFPAELPLSGAPGAPPAVPEFSPEPEWGSFELEAEPEPPPFSAPIAEPEPFSAPSVAPAAEPYDREPAFTFEPDPTYQVESEPVFELEPDAPSFTMQEEVFAAPADLAVDEAPQDRYLPDLPLEPGTLEEAASAAAGTAAAGFAWSPEPEPAPPAAPEPAPVVAPAAANGGLSEQEVERIARRVVELLGDRAVREVAWEVIPDLAEVIIRDRLRELEAQVE